MCSYLGCFPPKVPQRILKQYFEPGQRILDPFCGSGTTLVEALQFGCSCIGTDLNPLALAIAQAKTQRVTLEDVDERIMALSAGYSGLQDLAEAPDSIRMLFHPRTLAQMLHIRRELREDTPEDLFIRGMMLGIMHGKFRKNKTTAYLSIDMPNTFSMSPTYVRGFVEKHKLQQPLVDVFSQLRERARWLLREGALTSQVEAKVLSGDATRLPEVLSALPPRPIHGIITSPPYLGILRYGAFNWIRLWFLHSDPTSVDRTLDSTDSLDRYLAFMSNFLNSAAEVLPSGAPVALVIGDVIEFGVQLRLAKRVWSELEGLVPFEYVDVKVDNWDDSSKTTRIWGEERKGRATPLDRILVIRRRSLRKGKRPRSAA